MHYTLINFNILYIYPFLINKFFEYDYSSDLITQNQKILAIYHGNPKLTPKDQLRISICLTVPINKYIQQNDTIINYNYRLFSYYSYPFKVFLLLQIILDINI